MSVSLISPPITYSKSSIFNESKENSCTVLQSIAVFSGKKLYSPGFMQTKVLWGSRFILFKVLKILSYLEEPLTNNSSPVSGILYRIIKT